MATGRLTIDDAAVRANWRTLDRVGTAETGAVVKADGYGLGAARMARALAAEGARSFFVADASEGAAVRGALGPGPRIFVFGGHMAGDTGAIRDGGLIPLLNSPGQWARHAAALPGAPFGVQLDTGMARLGVAPEDWPDLRAAMTAPALVISHLACADDPGDPMNEAQRAAFAAMTDEMDAPRSLSATGGILLGAAYHHDLVRPGIGLYGGAPFAAAAPVVGLCLPVIQTRRVPAGTAAGYGATWRAARPSTLATVSGGYADGLHRALSNGARLWAGDVPCPLAGRVSMDLLIVDVTDVPEPPETLDILGPGQGIDALAAAAGTIGYEVLTSLGRRYRRDGASRGDDPCHIGHVSGTTTG